MLIGLMSDTHNDVEMTRKALDVFRERDVSMVLHAGDLTSPRMLTLFEGLEVRLVLGNGDLDEDVINSESERLGFGPVGKTCVFTAGERVFQMFHGNNVPAFRHAIASAKYDYIIKGHTHIFEDYFLDGTHVINPGALYGAEEFTVALLDTDKDSVEKIILQKD